MWGLEIKQADCLLEFQKEAEKFFHFCSSFPFSYKDQALKLGYKALSQKVP